MQHSLTLGGTHMILYFTGTGNSEYLALALRDALADDCVDAREDMKRGAAGQFDSETPYVFVFPTYAWRMPHVFEDSLRRSEFSGCRKAYFVMVCGADTGNAGAYCARLCEEKGLEYCGLLPVVMPDNYVVMYDVTPPDQVEPLLRAGEEKTLAAAEKIRAGQPFDALRITPADKAKSSVMNRAFFKTVSAKKFRATDKCVACGLCEKVCPLKNITLTGGRPVWGGNCTHCMACISRCPKRAIEYGKGTELRRRYVCPER